MCLVGLVVFIAGPTQGAVGGAGPAGDGDAQRELEDRDERALVPRARGIRPRLGELERTVVTAGALLLEGSNVLVGLILGGLPGAAVGVQLASSAPYLVRGEAGGEANRSLSSSSSSSTARTRG